MSQTEQTSQKQSPKVDDRRASAMFEILPIVEQTSCGTGCGSGCGSSCGTQSFSNSETLENGEVHEVKFDERVIDLDAMPTDGTPVGNIDLDITVECNLRCTYCFKEKWNEHMEEQVAFDSIVWLLHASGPRKDVSVSLMGGEPLIRFKFLKRLIPFAKRRARAHGKRIHFGMTTNGTLVTDEVVDFWKRWGLGFHTSIDGTPDVQDRNRPTTAGRGSSRLVEKAVPKILAYRPNTTARSTVVPGNADNLVDAYTYFRSLGYSDIAFVPGQPEAWDPDSLAVYEKQYMQVTNLLIQELKNGIGVRLKGISDYMGGVRRGHRTKATCGAGRGLLLVDLHGDIWPCHRWNKERQASWRIGSIYKQFNEAARSELDVDDQTILLEQDCDSCIANRFCSGGCPAENLEATGSVYKRHSNSCELTRIWARAGSYFHESMSSMTEPCEVYQEVYLS